MNGILLKYQGSGGAVTIPDSVTSIGDNAFFGCTGLTSVTIPNSVTSIGGGAFSGCTGLTSVTIPDSVTSIGGSSFYSCTGLASVTIPNNVTDIGWGMFQNCSALTSVTIPNRVTAIGGYAFHGCTALTNVVFPSSVTSVGNWAFRDTPWLEKQVQGEFAILNNILLAYRGQDSVVAVPGNVTSIGGGAFYGCTSLTSVTIPNRVTRIGDSAFYDCENLTSVTIPNSVTHIDGDAFDNCGNLTDVYFIGTEEQWKAIEIYTSFASNYMLLEATIHYNPTQPTTPTLPTVEPIPARGTAVARTQTVKLDGKDVQFQYYAVKDANGNESNYVKVRDLANALNGTKAQFNVGWNGKISITSNTAYQVVGGEGTTPYSGNQSYTAVSDIAVSFNGSDVKLTSFQLKDSKGNGYTYYKLRDLGQLLNFNVKWDGSVVIETDKPFTGK